MAVAPEDLEALALAGLYLAGVTLAFQGNRTMLHVATGNVAWFAFLFRDWLLPFVALLGLAALAAWAALRPPRLFLDVMGGERDLGPAMFFLGLSFVWALTRGQADLFVLFVLPLAFADPVGFYAGRAFGRHRLPNHKTWEGFAAVLATSLVVVLATLAWLAARSAGPGTPVDIPSALFFAVPLALGNAVGESLAPRHLDNLLMPLGGWLFFTVALTLGSLGGFVGTK